MEQAARELRHAQQSAGDPLRRGLQPLQRRRPLRHRAGSWGALSLASLQSDAGRALLRALEQPIPEGEPDTIVLIERGSVYTRSDAALRIARGLRGPVRLLALLRLVPRRIRDALYRFVARNRFRWFGRRDQCWVPTPALQSRFLDGPAGRP